MARKILPSPLKFRADIADRGSLPGQFPREKRMNRRALTNRTNGTPSRSEPDAAIRRQRALADYFREQAEGAETRIAKLKAEHQKARVELARRYEEQLTDLRERLDRSELRLGRARETIDSLDAEFDCVTRELEAERDRLTAESTAVPELSRARDHVARTTIRVLEEELRTLTHRLAASQRLVAELRRNGGRDLRRA